jgi:hypothetical protein
VLIFYIVEETLHCEGIFASVMLRSLIYISLFISVVSCTRKEPVETKEAMKKRLDSMSAERIRQIDERYQRDLHYRIKIEAVRNRDSIHNAINTTPATSQ